MIDFDLSESSESAVGSTRSSLRLTEMAEDEEVEATGGDSSSPGVEGPDDPSSLEAAPPPSSISGTPSK